MSDDTTEQLRDIWMRLAGHTSSRQINRVICAHAADNVLEHVVGFSLAKARYDAFISPSLEWTEDEGMEYDTTIGYCTGWLNLVWEFEGLEWFPEGEFSWQMIDMIREASEAADDEYERYLDEENPAEAAVEQTGSREPDPGEG